MSWKGILRKAGISSDGVNVTFAGGIYGTHVPGVASPNIKLFVDKLISASGNGGKWTSAYKTIAEAITASNAAIDWAASPWAPRYEIHIAPGLYAENITSLPYGADLIGYGDSFDINGERGVTIKPASGSAIDVTSCINSKIHNICFSVADTSAIFQADNFNRNIITKCVFAGVPGASPTTTRGLEIVKDMTGNIISGCIWLVCRNGIYVVTDNANSKQASGNIIEDSYIVGGDQTGIYFHTNCVPSYTMINNCNIAGGGATLALGLDDNTGVVSVFNTNFQATACDPASGDGDSKYNNCYLNGALMT